MLYHALPSTVVQVRSEIQEFGAAHTCITTSARRFGNLGKEQNTSRLFRLRFIWTNAVRSEPLFVAILFVITIIGCIPRRIAQIHQVVEAVGVPIRSHPRLIRVEPVGLEEEAQFGVVVARAQGIAGQLLGRSVR